ncbi:hypothetical protein [Thiohalorhabdus methylotrophus]|uniref:MSHA biogenesis protein MshJ n=1 Tax=Thiohalorhabdus methylotrophus TaxID=3242694 RepID=A0ABV4U1Y8_9GAMM
MKDWWARLEARLDARTLRERVLVFAAVTAVLGFSAYRLAIAPALAELERLQERADTVRGEVKRLRHEASRLDTVNLREETARVKGRRADLRGALREERRALRARVGEFIRPERLMRFFEDLLLARNAGDITVKKISGLQRQPVALNGPDAANPASVPLARKGVEVVVETDYPSTLGFLDTVEGLPWAVQITELGYEVLSYPRARVSLTAHTFLLDATGKGDGA